MTEQDSNNNNIFPTQSHLCGNAKIIWLYGLSGAGKTTLAESAADYLRAHGQRVYLLDGDNLRHGLNSDLGFSMADRYENIRRASEVAKLVGSAFDIVICTFITPYLDMRNRLDESFADWSYYRIHVSTPMKICEERDTKGLYKKARSGAVQNFTGVDSDFEPPQKDERHIDCFRQCTADSLRDLLTMCELSH